MKHTYNPLIYAWLCLALILALPILCNNIGIFFRGWQCWSLETLAHALLILGGMAYVSAIVLITFKQMAGVWLLFLATPVAYAVVRFIFTLVGMPDADKGGVMLCFYVALPLLLNLVTLVVLFAKKDGLSGWLILRHEHDTSNY